MNYQPIPKQRLTFRNCKLVKVTSYVSKFRDIESRVYRQTFETPDFDGQLVYTGKLLDLKEGQAIKATVKRYESFGIKFLRISRPILLDMKPAPLYEGLSKAN